MVWNRETFVFLFPSKCVCACVYFYHFFPSSNLYYAQISTLKWNWMCSGVKCDGSTLYTRLSACHAHTLENVQFDRMCSTFGIHVHVRNKSFASRIDEPQCVIYISEWHHTVHWYFSYTLHCIRVVYSELTHGHWILCHFEWKKATATATKGRRKKYLI